MSLLWRRSRKNKEAWQHIWLRDQGRCQGPYCIDRPVWSLALEECHIDHIETGQLTSKGDANLRILCRRCYVLRANRHQVGLIASALCDGIIGPDWRSLVWDD